MARNPPSPLIRVVVASSIREMQSQRIFPSGVQSSKARWPIANLGCVPIPMSPGSYWRNPLWCEILSRSSVVHDWPSGGMYWRSSSQTGHWAGGASVGGYCVPQALQMNAGMVSPVQRSLNHRIFVFVGSAKRPNVSFGSIATVWQCPSDFRFRLESRNPYQTSACLRMSAVPLRRQGEKEKLRARGTANICKPSPLVRSD